MAGMIIAGFLMGDIGDKALKGQVYMLHKSTGISILILMLFRAAWTLNNTKPALPNGSAVWERIAELSLHGLLYVILIVMPLTGWIFSTAAGHAPHFFGLFSMPLPGIPESKALAKQASNLHEIIAWIIIVLVGTHIAAALKHHFVNKNNVLTRMLPNRNKAS